jgi:RNA polymerase-binding transcription factor DksA
MTSVRERLEAGLHEAEEELQELQKQLDDRPELGLGEGGAGAYSWEMALARRERVIARMAALRRALTKVRNGTYGRCEGCGARIDPERLEILPTTSLCAACARAADTSLTSTPGARSCTATKL